MISQFTAPSINCGPDTVRTIDHLRVLLLLLYLAVLVIRPENRFPLLASVHFERLIIFLCWVFAFISLHPRLTLSSTTALLGLLSLHMLCSFLLSPYRIYPGPQHWAQNFWKTLVFYLLITYSVRQTSHLSLLFRGLVVVGALYQLYSWYDFLHGGSYVYQQGFRRMIGIWSQGGLGAPNAYAFFALTSMPPAIFWAKTAPRRIDRFCMVAYLCLSTLSIFFTGTRAAAYGIPFLLFLYLVGRRKSFFALLFVLLLIYAVAAALLPEPLKYRYLSYLGYRTDTVEERFNTLQRSSAASRLQGLKDGFALALKRPLTGWGPGASAVARCQINPSFCSPESDPLELHSLYGQVLGDVGFPGFFLFGAILCLLFRTTIRIRRHQSDISRPDRELAKLLFVLCFLLLFYGFASHILYRYNLYFLLGCYEAFVQAIAHKGTLIRARR